MSSFFLGENASKKELKKNRLCWWEKRREGRVGQWHARSRMWGRGWCAASGMGAALMQLQQLRRLLIMLMLALLLVLLLLMLLQQQNNRIN